MYKYLPPTPLEIPLTGSDGHEIREAAHEYLKTELNTKGAERGSVNQQGYGALAEIVVRDRLDMPRINPADHPKGFDVLMPTGVKVDVKCRGGKKAFRELYESADGIEREAKHNFFARQFADERLDADIFLMTHLRTAGDGKLPGTVRQKNWSLYICGWVSKARAIRDGVYLPRGSLTEQGQTWFTYRGQEIEFYHRHLCGLGHIKDLLKIDADDVLLDASRPKGLHLTTADAIRIAQDLVGRGGLTMDHLRELRRQLATEISVGTVFNANQYLHLIDWLRAAEILDDESVERAKVGITAEPYSGI